MAKVAESEANSMSNSETGDSQLVATEQGQDHRFTRVRRCVRGKAHSTNGPGDERKVRGGEMWPGLSSIQTSRERQRNCSFHIVVPPSIQNFPSSLSCLPFISRS